MNINNLQVESPDLPPSGAEWDSSSVVPGEARGRVVGRLPIEAVNNERKLWDGSDFVSSSLNKWGACGGGKSGADGVSLLVEVNLSLPFSPDLEWGEHATLTALVTESTLAGSVSTGSGDTWNTCDGTTGSPRLGGVFVASLPVDTVGLSSVQSHVGVAELNEIVSDWSAEHGGHGGGAIDVGFRCGIVDADSWTGSHIDK